VSKYRNFEEVTMSQEDAVARERIRSLGTRDWFLQQLVRLANDSGDTSGLAVTLCVKGIVVCGFLVSGRAYFREFARGIATALTHADESTRRSLREYCDAFGELYAPPDEEPEPAAGANEVMRTLPEFIHLRAARVFGGTMVSPPTSQEGVWWRGRIAEIDGFMLGTALGV
jgi:hypothetical protein